LEKPVTLTIKGLIITLLTLSVRCATATRVICWIF
jgi:hypothetical protein